MYRKVLNQGLPQVCQQVYDVQNRVSYGNIVQFTATVSKSINICIFGLYGAIQMLLLLLLLLLLLQWQLWKNLNY